MRDSRTTRPAFTWIAVNVCLLAGLASAQIPVNATNPSVATPTYNIDQPGRIPYQSTVVGQATQYFIFFVFDPVPSGHRLVIQQMSGEVLTSPIPSDTKIQGILSDDRQLNDMWFTVAPFTQSGSGMFTQEVQYYLDAGEIPEVVVFHSVFSGSMTLTGYLLDCNVAPCAPRAGAKAPVKLPDRRPVKTD